MAKVVVVTPSHGDLASMATTAPGSTVTLQPSSYVMTALPPAFGHHRITRLAAGRPAQAFVAVTAIDEDLTLRWFNTGGVGYRGERAHGRKRGEKLPVHINAPTTLPALTLRPPGVEARIKTLHVKGRWKTPHIHRSISRERARVNTRSSFAYGIMLCVQGLAGVSPSSSSPPLCDPPPPDPPPPAPPPGDPLLAGLAPSSPSLESAMTAPTAPATTKPPTT